MSRHSIEGLTKSSPCSPKIWWCRRSLSDHDFFFICRSRDVLMRTLCCVSLICITSCALLAAPDNANIFDTLGLIPDKPPST